MVENEFWESDAEELTQTNPWCQRTEPFNESSPFKAYDQLTRRLDFRIDDLFARDASHLIVHAGQDIFVGNGHFVRGWRPATLGLLVRWRQGPG